VQQQWYFKLQASSSYPNATTHSHGRYGTTTTEAIHTLYTDGGWKRYYQGLTEALIRGPLSRFGDTAANAGILALNEKNYLHLFASLAVAAFRMIFTPVDTVNTTLQTQGCSGMVILSARVRILFLIFNFLLFLFISVVRFVAWSHRNCGSHLCWTLPSSVFLFKMAI